MDEGTRVGITLPSFRSDAATALEVARQAETAGLHGVFCFDHLWPIGGPERPSLSWVPLLGAVAALTEQIRLGPLVARIGLVPEAVLYRSLRGLQAICGERLLAGIGTGDSKSADEERRNGIAFLGPAERRRLLLALCGRLVGAGIETVVGAGHEETSRAAQALGAGVNFWAVAPEDMVPLREGGPISWAGPLGKDPGAASASIRSLSAAGAGWVIWAWPSSVSVVAKAAASAGIALGG
ncbi:MAG: LLM class flavin-dependent oxidoreductase [Acidimicrobiales bacterium]